MQQSQHKIYQLQSLREEFSGFPIQPPVSKPAQPKKNSSLLQAQIKQAQSKNLEQTLKTDGRKTQVCNSLYIPSLAKKKLPVYPSFLQKDDQKQNNANSIVKSRLSVFKEFQDIPKDYAAISTKDDESDTEFDKLMSEIDMNLKQSFLDSCQSSPRRDQEHFETLNSPIQFSARTLQHSSSEKIMKKDNTQHQPSKILKIMNVRDQQNLKTELSCFGKIIFQDSHYLNQNHYIVKYERIEDAESAFTSLAQKYEINYISTQHASDEALYYLNKIRGGDQQEEDACLTLNMFKLKSNVSYQNNSQRDNAPYQGLNTMNDSFKQSFISNQTLESYSSNNEDNRNQVYTQQSNLKFQQSLYQNQIQRTFSVPQYHQNNLQFIQNTYQQQQLLAQQNQMVSNFAQYQQQYYGNQQMMMSRNDAVFQNYQNFTPVQRNPYQINDLQSKSQSQSFISTGFEYADQQKMIPNHSYIPQMPLSMIPQRQFSSVSPINDQFYPQAQQQINQNLNLNLNQRINSELQTFKDQVFLSRLEESSKQITKSFEEYLSLEKAIERVNLSASDEENKNQENETNQATQVSNEVLNQSISPKNDNEVNLSEIQQNFILPSEDTSSFQQSQNTRHNTGFKLNLNDILNFKDQRTTIMIKNIPNKYTQKMLLAKINQNHKDKYDFFYLPIDFKNKCNVGYAFINFVDSIFILKFFEEFNGKRWECFNSEKICEITYGRIQGKLNLSEHFDQSNLWYQNDRKVKPLILNVVPPTTSFLKDYRKNLLLNFGQKETQLKFQKREEEQDTCQNYTNSGNDYNGSTRQVRKAFFEVNK